MTVTPGGLAKEGREPSKMLGLKVKRSIWVHGNRDDGMKARVLTFLAFALIPAVAWADPITWQRYVIPSTGAKVDIPVSIFSEDGGPAESGSGRRFFARDRRADLTLQSVPNP